MKALIAGYRRFRAGAWRQNAVLFDRLARDGQAPRAMVIACADSRQDPQLVFDAQPGELFVVRNVAALVPAYAPDSGYHGTSAALEFAIRALKVQQVIVMGHAQCGGVQALIDGAPETCGDFVQPWMEIAHSARQHALSHSSSRSECLMKAEVETVRVSMANLLTFPWIRERVEAGEVEIHGLYFDVATGALSAVLPDGIETL
jgi:carbonic anhydrase